MSCVDDEALEHFLSRTKPVEWQQPRRESVLQGLMTLQTLQESGFAEVRFQNVRVEDVPVFLREYNFVDADVRIQANSGLCFSDESAAEYGSGVSADVTAAACHGACEALERLLPKLGGMRGARANEFTAYSVKQNSWCEFNYNPVSRFDAQNPFREQTCGQAVHPIANEALRNAFCELIERNTIALLDGNEKWFDITQSLVVRNPAFRKSEEQWLRRGFVFRVAVTLAPHGPFVVVASAISAELGGFPASYRGSACDFSLEYAPEQALSELNRSGHFGPYIDVESVESARADRKKYAKNDYHFGFLSRLIEPDWLANCSKGAETFDVDDVRKKGICGPCDVVRSILKTHEDIFIVPYCDSRRIGFHGYKICVPGFSLGALERTSL